MTQVSQPDEPPAVVRHAQRIAAAAQADSVPAKVIGGVGCWMHNVEHSDAALRWAREYHDVDVVVPRKLAVRGGRLLEELGYAPVSSFNSVQGETRLMYVAEADQLRIDVFVGTFEMCHAIPLADVAFTPEEHPALNLVELLLTKLQVVNSNEKDLRDVASLLVFHELGGGRDDIDSDRFARLLRGDWGLWRTVTTNLTKVEAYSVRLASEGAKVASTARTLRELAEGYPKSPKWKARAVVGERVRWYEQPEEPEVEAEIRIR